MNPLLSLWLFVVLCMAGITFIFWLIEHYGQYMGNFYVLAGMIVGFIVLSRLVSWLWKWLHRQNA